MLNNEVFRMSMGEKAQMVATKRIETIVMTGMANKYPLNMNKN